ncbi:MAG TPA: PQQ-binding-like beta-propeller repeat protein [Sphingomonadaceae bacterium]|nr:PQQ-binding-like beta-propeller repeat protein [Sphingomonadaceae bacterium]
MNNLPSGRRVGRAWALRKLGLGCSLALACTLSTQALAQGVDYSTWENYLGGGESSQYSSLDQINTGNVDQLEVAWTFEAGSGGFGFMFGPIVVDGVMYAGAGSDLVALDAATGEEIWRTSFEGGIGGRGINLWQSEDGSEKRLMVLNGGILRAVNADTGEVIQSFGTNGGVDLRDALDSGTPPARPLQTNNPGRIFEDLIIVSLPAGAYDYASSPADIQAYNVRTGEHVWTFHTVPHPGEFGYDTWPENEQDKLGGVHNWSESTIDTENGIIFIPTGTARFDFYGGNRPGDNLFGNSILALNARTGERIWHFQTIHHDLWDYDIPIAPKLMTIKRDGQDVPIVVQPTKQGFLFVFNRLTGEPIWPIEERPVPQSDVPGEVASPTQPFPTWPEPFTRQRFTEDDINPYLPEEDQAKLREILRNSRNDGLFTPPSLEGTIMMPGHNGGANWSMAAIDPERARLYIVNRNIPTMAKLVPDTRPTALENMPNSGGDVQPYRSPVDFMLQPNGMVAIAPPFSSITLYDMNTGIKLWQVPNGDIAPLAERGITNTGAQTPRGSPVVTGGGLLFIGTTTDRTIRARDANTGQILWEHKVDAAIEGVPAVYEADGRQFVVVPVGGGGHFATGLGLPEPGSNKYIAFALPKAGE